MIPAQGAFLDAIRRGDRRAAFRSLDEALPWEPRASHRYATAEAEARKQRRGLWKDWLGER